MPGLCDPCNIKDVVQTPLYPGYNHVLIRQFSARNFVFLITGRHELKSLSM